MRLILSPFVWGGLHLGWSFLCNQWLHWIAVPSGAVHPICWGAADCSAGSSVPKVVWGVGYSLLQQREKKFPLAPKGHYLHHQFLDLLHQGIKADWCLNILAFANQMQEDFIGKPSRLARRVSSKTTSLRVIQRTFLAMRTALGGT